MIGESTVLTVQISIPLLLFLEYRKREYRGGAMLRTSQEVSVYWLHRRG